VTELPKLPADPRTPKELEDWLKHRPQDQPLTPRESIMVERLRRSRFPYSIT
jgi:hypothetical protein